MSQRGRPAARGGHATEGDADYAAMFEAMMTSIMRRMPASGPSVDVGVQVQTPRLVDFAKLCKDYTTLGGKVFLGTESTIEVQRWIDACRRIFGDLGIEGATKRKLASRQLQGRASDWWNSITIDTPEEEVTWEQFQARFEAKFISTAQKSILFKKFVELKQGGRSVLEYVSEFEALSKYARSYIESAYQKNEKFMTGLDSYLGR